MSSRVNTTFTVNTGRHMAKFEFDERSLVSIDRLKQQGAFMGQSGRNPSGVTGGPCFAPAAVSERVMLEFDPNKLPKSMKEEDQWAIHLLAYLRGGSQKCLPDGVTVLRE